jgi:serine protease AprX
VVLVIGSGLVAAGTGTAGCGATGDADGASVDPTLANETGERTVIVQFEAASDGADADPESRRADVAATQQAFDTYANATDGVSVEESFWITNAAVAQVDTDRAPLDELADVDGVEAIRADGAVAPDGPETTGSDTEASSTPNAAAAEASAHTDSLGQIRAGTAWETYQTRGEGSSIAVLDSGVDGAHPDLDVEKWNDFGDEPAPEPVAYDDHGTHVSGTAAGGADGGTHIGVPPDADLYHGAVMTDCDDDGCVGYDRTIIAGIEWAVEEDADVILMSLGQAGHNPALIDAISNANDAGTYVVASIGNQGEDGSTSSGNIYDVTSVSAMDDSGAVADFSSSETIETDDDWSGAEPGHWPESYTVPTLVGPGVDVESTVPGGDYETKRGTSMAAPHVAETAAFVQSATTVELEEALLESATPLDDDRAERYGHGAVDAVGAIERAGDYGAVEGTITDSKTETPLENASVTIAGDDVDRETTTDADGGFELTGIDGDRTYDVHVDHERYERTTDPAFVVADETTTIDRSTATLRSTSPSRTSASARRSKRRR